MNTITIQLVIEKLLLYLWSLSWSHINLSIYTLNCPEKMYHSKYLFQDPAHNFCIMMKHWSSPESLHGLSSSNMLISKPSNLHRTSPTLCWNREAGGLWSPPSHSQVKVFKSDLQYQYTIHKICVMLFSAQKRKYKEERWRFQTNISSVINDSFQYWAWNHFLWRNGMMRLD